MSHAAGMKRTKPKQARVLRLEVVGSRRISPSFVRLTLGGEGLQRFQPQGYDQWFRLFLPRQGQERMRLPTRTSDLLWYAQYLATPRPQRPWVRNVTVRDHRPAGPGTAEIDMDVVVHGEPGEPGTGPLSTWAQTARATRWACSTRA